MKPFKHYDVNTLDEAVSALQNFAGKAKIIAGGTDIVGMFKDEVFAERPEALINIKTIPNLDYIKEEDGMLKIGPLALLEDIAHDELIKGKYTALAEAARRTASPHIREMGTISGNICQQCRCWYFRSPNNRFNCIRKGGEDCYAEEGENRYHSIFGNVKDCLAVNPSDTAPALIALGAKVKTSKRVLEIADFYEKEEPKKTTVLDDDEIVVEIQVPQPAANSKSKFEKFAIRKSIDFPIVNCASQVEMDGDTVKSARVCLNAVFANPDVAQKAAEYVVGKTLDEETVTAAADLALQDAKPLTKNAYKITIAKSLIKKTLLACK